MFDFEKFKNIDLYKINKNKKNQIFLNLIKDLTLYHYKKCNEYKSILKSTSFNVKNISSIYDIPYLPVRLFKNFELKSIKESNIFKILRSSGTTNQITSKIYLDKINANNQVKVLNKITSETIGKKRLPMLIIDTESILKNKSKISARTAAINGFSIFGKEQTFVLDEQMNLKLDKLKNFLEKHKNEEILIFGFTYIVWSHFYEAIEKNKIKINMNNCILVHGGGWKKLINKKITNEKFKDNLKEKLKISKVYNYYGMVEQTGSIFMECEKGFFHASDFSDIIIRKSDLTVCENKKEGIVQLLSLLPTSYPGHSILTDDIGFIEGVDDCKCNKKGKYFKITQRVSKSDLRGCSDTFEI